jgi:DNA polymerase-3 subunit alpha
VKFDFLSLEGNTKIAQATHLVENIDGNAGANNVFQCCNALETADKIIGKVSALPGKSNWSDTSYLDDPKTIEMANKGDLKMIFQYDGSEGIRRLAKQGGVTSFDDLAAYTALYRPSCLKYGMHDTYCKRKRGEEKYELHPLLEPILGKTYGVMVFQESIMRILNVVGNIPLKDCETVRKAISKKKVDKFKKYKEMFVTNGQKNLSLPEEEVVKLWDQIEAFAGYGFNMSHCVAYTYISARMLYLKAHHPLAFYTSVIDCTKAAGPISTLLATQLATKK